MFKDNRLPLLFTLPAIFFMLAVYLSPLSRVLKQSVTALDGSLTSKGYEELWSNSLFAKVLWTTIETSLLATALTLLLGYTIAYHLYRQTPRRRAYLAMLVLLPFWTSILVKSFAFTIVLGHDGIINQALRLLPWVDRGVKLLFNHTGVMIGLTHYFIPFMVFPILASLISQNPDLPKAAQTMGAGGIRIFWRITLPLSIPGVIAGSLLTFVLALGFFITPALLGGRKDMMIANLVNFYTREVLDWTLASSLSVILLLVTVVMIFVLLRVPGGQQVLGDGPGSGGRSP